MAYLDWLESALSPALSAKRVGEPLALRAFFELTADHGLLVPVLAQATEMAGRWFGSSPTRLYAQGGAALGYISVLAEYAGGESALLTTEVLHGQPPMALLLLIGNHGTLRYDDRPAGLTSVEHDSPLRSLIEMSIRSGKAVGVGGKDAV